MVTTLQLFAAVYLGTYALSCCPLFADSVYTLFGLATLAAIAVVIWLERLQLIAPGFSPRIKYKKSAVLVVGADQSLGWQAMTRSVAREMIVYAAVDDLESPQADWIRRHLFREVVLLRLDPSSDADVAAAVRLVEDTIGDRQLVGVVYSKYLAPKLKESLDLNEVNKGIEINALGAVRVAEAFAPLLQKHNGRYIIVADMAGRIVLPSLVSHCMSQAVTLQFAEIISKNLKKYNISIHTVQPFLYTYKKTKDNKYYPQTTDEGKIVVESSIDGVDFQSFWIMMYIFEALMSKRPKAHYVPTYFENLMDKLIRYAPPCVYNHVTNNYFKKLTKQFETS